MSPLGCKDTGLCINFTFSISSVDSNKISFSYRTVQADIQTAILHRHDTCSLLSSRRPVVEARETPEQKQGLVVPRLGREAAIYTRSSHGNVEVANAR